jgi:hypothetical protein
MALGSRFICGSFFSEFLGALSGLLKASNWISVRSSPDIFTSSEKLLEHLGYQSRNKINLAGCCSGKGPCVREVERDPNMTEM